MSQVNELLNNLTEEEMAAYTANPETEPHIVINEDRSITVPYELRKIAVQYDHNVETVTFDCPRYWDGLDMSQMVVYINYRRPDGYLDSYPADNVRVSDTDDGIMNFEWTISRNVTFVKGVLSFLVCIKKTNENGEVEINHWNSELNNELTISEGLECNSEEIVEENIDLITQLLLRVNNIQKDFEAAVNEHITDVNFVVNVEAVSDGTGTADKTYDEIEEAYRDGKNVLAYVEYVDVVTTGEAEKDILNLIECGNSVAKFSNISKQDETASLATFLSIQTETVTDTEGATIYNNICSIEKVPISSGVADGIFQATETTPTLGEELASAEGWTSEGWTGDFENGFVHTVGQTTPLIFTMPEATGENLYQVDFDVTNCSPSEGPNASVAFSVILGNSVPFITYNGGGAKHYSFGIKSVSDGNLQFILTNPADPFTTEGTFDGTIENISVKRILAPYPALIETKDVDGDVNIEIRANDTSLGNFYMGKNSGRYNTSGNLNVGVGNQALENVTSGYWNVAIGNQAMQYTNVGSRSIGIGRLALQYNNGDRNYAIGTFALERNTSGRHNVGIGADTLWVNTTGSRNIGIGSASQCAVTTSNDNISIGHGSMADKPEGNRNIAIGSYAQSTGVSEYCVAIGYMAQYKGGGTDHNISIGYYAGGEMKGTYTVDENGKKTYAGASSNVSVGNHSLSKLTTGRFNAAIGHCAGRNATTCDNDVFIGFYAGNSLITGNANVFIGSHAGSSGTTAYSSTIIGAYAGLNITTGGSNICIGYMAGKNITTGGSNICIGNSVQTPAENTWDFMNIGDIIFGQLKGTNGNVRRIGIATGSTEPVQNTIKALLHIGASDGTYPPLALKAGANVATLVDGAFEYDGTNLYFTAGGVRQKVALEAIA